MLKELLEKNELKDVLLSVDNYKPFPNYNDRSAWTTLSEDLKAYYLNQAEEYLDYNWPQIKATLYMEFFREGNRSRYEEVCFKRRKIIFTLLLAECIEGKGRFIDDIINGIWAICEESSWVIPAHNNYMTSDKDALPDITPDVIFIDLFSAETASLMAWVCYFLEEVLDKQSPLICKRIRCELTNRIIKPYIETEKMRWMGFQNKPVNNWNPWINSNVLTVFLIIEKDEKTRLEAVKKCIESLENFLEGYPADGGCDEGPSYWNVAGGSLVDCLEMLFEATKGKLNVFQDELIKNIGRYIYRAHIAGKYFVNFADGSPIAKPDYPLIYRLGIRIGDKDMVDFGASMFVSEEQFDSRGWNLFRTFKKFMTIEELKVLKHTPPLVQDVWLENLEFMTARENKGSDRGLYLAAKGGHNNESHNHNDIGSFILFANGTPVFIDIGVETYSAKTFSNQRYEIWTMQSSYHNLPEINGFMQMSGEQYEAEVLGYMASEEKVEFCLDITGAYPKEAKVNKWERTFELNRTSKASVKLRDCYDLAEPTKVIILNFITCQIPNISNDKITMICKDGSKVVMKYDSKVFDALIEEIILQDIKLINEWRQESLYRIRLHVIDEIVHGESEIDFFIE